MRSAFLTSRVAIRVATGMCAFACATLRAQDARSLAVDLGDDQVIELIHLPAGTFAQGSPTTEPQRSTDETQRTVTLTRAFFIGKYPVTCGQFARFIADTSYRTEAEKGGAGGVGWDGTQFVQRREFTWKMPGFAQTDEDPVTLVTYADARAFLAWLSEKSGRIFSLPSEAQWEYACRAGTTTAFPNGDDPARLNAIAWYRGNSSGGTRSVGQRALNGWGIGDMLGNVWEWCDDWYAPYADGPVTDPVRTEPNLPEKPRRVLRGGSWARDAAVCRSAARYRNDPASRNADNGFRVMTFDAAPPPALATPTKTPPDLNAPPQPIPETARSVPAHPVSAPQESADHRQPQGTGITGVALFLTVLGGIAVIVTHALRRIISGGGIGVARSQTANPYRGSSARLRTRIVDDGFWVESSELPDGTVLDCRYAADGEDHHEKVAFRAGPRGQFVFTGSRPTSVAVTLHPGSVPTTLPQRKAAMDLGMHKTSDEPRDEKPRPIRKHPPAQ